MPEPWYTNPWVDVLSNRTRNCLRSAGILSVEGLRAKKPEELLALPAFGSGCLEEVTWFLKLQDLPYDKDTDGEVLPITAPLSSSPYFVMLSERTRNRLYSGGIFTLADLVEWDEASLLRLKGFGARGLDEVNAFLEANGLLPAPSADDPTRQPKRKNKHYRLLPEGTRAALDEAGIRVDADLKDMKLEDLLAIPNVNARVVDDLVAAGALPRPRDLRDLLLVLSASETARAALSDLNEPYIDRFLSSIERCETSVDKQVERGTLHEVASMDYSPLQVCNEKLRPPARTLPALLFNLRYLPNFEAVGVVDKLTAALEVPTLDAELTLLPDLLDERDIAVLRGRFAVDRRLTTLGELGARFGVTRERIRQIEKRVSEDLRKAYYWDVPLLRVRTAMLLVHQHGIASIDDAHSLLRERGLTDSVETVRDFFAVWRAIAPADSAVRSSLQAWRAINYRFYEFPREVVTAAATGLTRKQRKMSADTKEIAHRRLRVLGVIGLEESLRELEAHEASAADVAAILASIGLNELAPGYWGTKDKKYAIHRVAEKMIKVCGPLPVADIHIGLFRHQQRQDKPTATMDALRAALERHEAFYLDADGVVHLYDLSEGAVPTSAEYAWFVAVTSHGPVVHASTVYRALADRGLNPGLMTYLIRYSEVVRPLGEGLYCLPGARFDETDLAAGRAQASSKWVKRYAEPNPGGPGEQGAPEAQVQGGIGKRLLTAREFAQSLDPPRSKEAIIGLLRRGRIEEATKGPLGEWLIPEGTIISANEQTKRQPKRQQPRKQQPKKPQPEQRQPKSLSPDEYARIHGLTREHVHYLLRGNRKKGAMFGKNGWDIPPDAPHPPRRA